MKFFHAEPEKLDTETYATSQSQGSACNDPGSSFSISSSKKCFASLPTRNHFLKGHLLTVNFLFIIPQTNVYGHM